jgi:hypothetical protein
MWGASPIIVAVDWGRAPISLDYVGAEGVAAKAQEIEPKDTGLWNSSAVYGGLSERTGGEEEGEIFALRAGRRRGTIQPLKRFNSGPGTGPPVTNAKIQEIRKLAAPKKHARLAAVAIPALLLGTAVSLRKGLNPDAPKNLTRAVVLGTNGSGAEARRSA